MASVKIKRKHQLDKDQVRIEVQKLAEKLGKELSANYQWQGDRLEFKRSGASGHIDIGDGMLDIEIKLNMLLSPLKSTIEKTVNDYLDESLG